MDVKFGLIEHCIQTSYFIISKTLQSVNCFFIIYILQQSVSKIGFRAGKGLENIYEIPVDSVHYSSEFHASARSMRARNCLSVFPNILFPK